MNEIGFSYLMFILFNIQIDMSRGSGHDCLFLRRPQDSFDEEDPSLEG